MEINELKNWAKEHNVDKRIIESFKGLLVNYKRDESAEYSKIMNGIIEENMTYEVHTISLNLGNWPDCTYNTVSASMRVYYQEKQIANYKVLYLFSGEVEDDFVDFNIWGKR